MWEIWIHGKVVSSLKPDFLFSKSKEEKKPKENGGSEANLNKDSEVVA